MQAVEVLAHLGPALKAPTRWPAHQFDAALRPVVLQLIEQALAQRVGADLVVKQHAHVAQRHGLLGADQRGFKNALGVR
jgi:hypothetical protein